MNAAVRLLRQLGSGLVEATAAANPDLPGAVALAVTEYTTGGVRRKGAGRRHPAGHERVPVGLVDRCGQRRVSSVAPRFPDRLLKRNDSGLMRYDVAMTPMTPAAASAATSDGSRPSALSTSIVCAPTSGAGPRGPMSAPRMNTGTATVRNRPFGCSM